MDQDGFRSGLDRFGPSFSRWPLDRARRALTLLGRSNDARRALIAARRAEHAIRGSRPVVSGAIAQRIVSAALTEIGRLERRPMPRRSTGGAVWMQAGLVLSLAAVGFLVGLIIGAPQVSATRDAMDGMIIVAGADDGRN